MSPSGLVSWPAQLLLLLVLLLVLNSATSQNPIPAPPPPETLAPVGVDLPQYPSFIGVAAKIRAGLYSRRTSLEQLNIWPHNDSTITIQGRTHQLDENGTVTIGQRRYQVSGNSVSINGKMYYPAVTTETPQRRKPSRRPLPEYDGRPFSSVHLYTLLSVTVPAATTMLVLLFCCMACTHRSCWCCGICDGRISATEIRKMFEGDDDDDKKPLTV